MATYSMSFKPAGNDAGVFPLSTGGPQAIDATSTTQNYALGTRILARDAVLGEAEFIYCKGVASTAVGDMVVIENDFTTARDATPKGFCGVAMSACVADNYGWYCIKGRVLVTIAADYTAGPVYMSATAGTVQSTIIVGSHVIGASGATALNAGGSAIAGTSDTTPANKVVALLFYPYGVQAV